MLGCVTNLGFWKRGHHRFSHSSWTIAFHQLSDESIIQWLPWHPLRLGPHALLFFRIWSEEKKRAILPYHITGILLQFFKCGQSNFFFFWHTMQIVEKLKEIQPSKQKENISNRPTRHHSHFNAGIYIHSLDIFFRNKTCGPNDHG